MTDNARESRRKRKAELALRAYVRHGTVKGAAADLGVSEGTIRRRCADYLVLKGYQTIAQAAYWLDRHEITAENARLVTANHQH